MKGIKIAFWTHKGGIGKTFLCSHVAYRAIEQHINLKIFDADAQANSMRLISGLNWKKGSGENFYREGSILVTTNFEEIKDNDFTIIDAPPQSSFFDTAMEADIPIDIWIMPFGDDQMEYEAMEESVSLIRKNRPNAKIIIVYNNISTYSQTTEQYLIKAKELKVELYKFIIPNRAVARMARTKGQPVWKIKSVSNDDCSLQTRKFADWVLGGCSGNVFNETNSQAIRSQRYGI